MDFEFSEEQRLLKDSVERLLKDRYDFEQRKSYMKEPGGFGRALWKQYADLGLLGLPFEEQHGGSGGGPVETMIIAEAFGRALALEPYLATVVLAGGLLRHAGTQKQRDAILPKVAEGSMLVAVAHAERQARYDLADVATAAKRDGAGYVIDGQKSLVLNGDAADKLIVSARVSGNRRDRDGLALFVIDAGAPGVTHRDYATVDGMRAADVTLANVKTGPDAVLGQAGAAYPVIERVADEAMAALCAEAVGAMAAMHELTLDYLRTRKQFGVPIGSFQVLQHRAVDMFVALEQARSMAISAAKVQIGRSGRIVGHGAIQLHGGIGMTMEYKVGHYFKRVTAIDTTFGDADHHLTEVGRLGGLIDPA